MAWKVPSPRISTHLDKERVKRVDYSLNIKSNYNIFFKETVSLRNLEFINDVGVNLYRIRKLMLSVLARFIISDSHFKDMMKPKNTAYEPNELNKANHIKYFLEVAANVILYCRNVVSNNSADHKSCGLLFSPNIIDAGQNG